eukprot:551841-Hanusia_phi.AAC.1
MGRGSRGRRITINALTFRGRNTQEDTSRWGMESTGEEQEQEQEQQGVCLPAHPSTIIWWRCGG